jgi:hypothetical protein
MRVDQILFEKIQESRWFGVWLGRLYYDTFKEEPKITNYDYIDDEKNKGLRYRFMGDNKFRQFVHDQIKAIENEGWHLTFEFKKARNRWQLVFEPTLTSRVPKNAIFWHLTPKVNVQSILQNGLIPQTSRHGIQYPQKRIYLIRNQNDAGHMAESFSIRDKNPIDYAVLKVDLRKTNVKVYIDSELSKVAVYTIEPIPSEALKEV